MKFKDSPRVQTWLRPFRMTKFCPKRSFGLFLAMWSLEEIYCAFCGIKNLNKGYLKLHQSYKHEEGLSRTLVKQFHGY